MSLPNQAPMPGMPEIPGAGPTPAPVTPGMMGNPSLLPSNLTQPANIGGSSYYLPFDPATTSIPGQLGPSLYVPPPASTPGTDPGMIHAPLDFIPPPVLVTNINPGGGLSGAAPINRWGGQTTRDFGLYRYGGTQKYDFGQGMVYGQASQDGPFQQLPGAVPTQDLYGARGYARGGATTQTIAPY